MILAAICITLAALIFAVLKNYEARGAMRDCEWQSRRASQLTEENALLHLAQRVIEEQLRKRADEYDTLQREHARLRGRAKAREVWLSRGNGVVLPVNFGRGPKEET